MLETIKKLIDEKNYNEIRFFLKDINDVEISDLLNQIESNTELLLIFRLLPKDRAANIFSYLDLEQQEAIIIKFTDKETENIFKELYFDDIIDIIEEMPANVVKKILKNTNPKDRTLINQFLKYPENSAGSIMTIEYVDFKKNMTVKQAIDLLRKEGIDKENIDTCYVIDENRIIQGQISLKKLISSSDSIIIGDIMDTNVITAVSNDNTETVVNLFKKFDLIILPIVDVENRLLGIITVDDIIDIIEEETTEDFHKMAGITPTDETEEPYLKTSSFVMAKQRILWLIVLMISATFTGRIIRRYEEILQSVVILAAFIPMLMDTGGNVGSQSSTVIIRSLSLGEIKPKDLFKILKKEFSISIIVSTVLGLLNFSRLFFLEKVDFSIAITVTITLVFTVIVAKLVGGFLPIVAKLIRVDPAVMASPLITTIVDAFALIIYFKFAGVFLGI